MVQTDRPPVIRGAAGGPVLDVLTSLQRAATAPDMQAREAALVGDDLRRDRAVPLPRRRRIECHGDRARRIERHRRDRRATGPKCGVRNYTRL